MKISIFKFAFILVPFLFACTGANNSIKEIDDLVNNGKYKEAANLILDPETIDFNENQTLQVAQFFSSKVGFEISIPILRKLGEKYPLNIATKLLLANNLREQKEFNESLAIYNEIALVDSVRFIVLPERARLYSFIHETEKAEKDIEEAKMLQPKYFAVFLADGLLQYSLGRQTEALDLFDVAIELDPGVSSEAALYAGYILLKNDLNYDALGKFTKAIDIGKNINMGFAFINRGVCQINLQDTVSACLDWDSGYYYMPEQANKYIQDYCLRN